MRVHPIPVSCSSAVLLTGLLAAAAAAQSPVRAVLPPELPWSGKSSALARPAGDAWATPVEASDFTRTPRYEETVAWLQKLVAAAPELRMVSLGTSAEGRTLWMVIASADGDFTPQAAHARGKPIVLAQGGIHAGEIDGKDAGLMLLRDMTVAATARDVLAQATFLFVPIFNVDGHERFSAFTRVNQRGPEEGGWRTTGANLNLNRDYAKADTPEMRAILRVLTAWDPHLYLDMHVTDGSDYQPDITFGYNGPNHASLPVGGWLDRVAAPAIHRDLAAMGHLGGTLLQLIDDGDPSKGIRGWWAEPRFSNGYGDYRHLPTLLLENHSLKPYRQRVLGARVFLESVIRLASREFDSLRSAIAEARAARRDPVVLEFGYDRDRIETIEVQGVGWRLRPSRASGGPVIEWTGQRETTTRPFLPMDRAVSSVTRPRAYLIPPAWGDVVERLAIHGIVTERLTVATTLEVEMYRVPEAKLAASVVEGRVMADPGRLVTERRQHTFPPGTVRVSTDQPLGDMAIALLEPAGVDSFFRWGFFHAILQQTEYIEPYIMAPTAERMLAADAALSAAFEKALAADPAFAGNPRARLRWFYERSPYVDDRFRLYPVARER